MATLRWPPPRTSPERLPLAILSARRSISSSTCFAAMLRARALTLSSTSRRHTEYASGGQSQWGNTRLWTSAANGLQDALLLRLLMSFCHTNVYDTTLDNYFHLARGGEQDSSPRSGIMRCLALKLGVRAGANSQARTTDSTTNTAAYSLFQHTRSSAII